jgi:hypothetical protein
MKVRFFRLTFNGEHKRWTILLRREEYLNISLTGPKLLPLIVAVLKCLFSWERTTNP